MKFLKVIKPVALSLSLLVASTGVVFANGGGGGTVVKPVAKRTSRRHRNSNSSAQKNSNANSNRSTSQTNSGQR